MIANQLTIFENPSVRLHSQFGFITFYEWCNREIERINAASGKKKAEMILSNDGRVAVAIQNI